MLERPDAASVPCVPAEPKTPAEPSGILSSSIKGLGAGLHRARPVATPVEFHGGGPARRSRHSSPPGRGRTRPPLGHESQRNSPVTNGGNHVRSES
jgi:hypothetical protein